MTDLTSLTAAMASAYFEANKVGVDQVEEVIRSIHAALTLAETGDEPEVEVEQPTNAQIRKSMTGDRLVSFEDGRPYASLKRHLTALDMTPEQYRAKWGLPAEYPMVSPGYSARRSETAKSLGLGRKPGAKRGRES